MIHGSRGIIVVVLGLALLLAPTSHAQVISSNVEIDDGGVFSSAPMGPAMSAQVTSFLDVSDQFTLDFSAPGFGHAVQRAAGSGAVMADILFANGQNPNSVRASTNWSDAATNNTAIPVTYTFQYVITPPSLRIGDYAGLPDASNNAPEISYSIEIRSNGAVVFESGAVLRGGRRGHTLTESGTSLNPVLTPNPLPPSPAVFGYDFSGRTDVITLGTFGPGETITVEYDMTVQVLTPGFEAGGMAQVGDPFDLDGTPGFTGQFFADGVIATESASWGELKRAYE